MANQIVRSDNSTVEVVVGTAITAPTVALEGTFAVFYTRDAAAGSLAAPYAWNTVVDIVKNAATDVFAVGDPVFMEIDTQDAFKLVGTTDGQIGICSKASANGDTHVRVLLNQGSPA